MNSQKLADTLASLDKSFLKNEGPSFGSSCKALVLNLDSESSTEFEIPTAFVDNYISGPALGARLWAFFAGDGADNSSLYEAENPVVITCSAVSNSKMPFGELSSIVFRSPETGSLMVNTASNSFGMRLNAIGYRALILMGRLRRPSVVGVTASGVIFDVSEQYVGATVSQMKSIAVKSSMTTVMAIGPAGEMKVPYACVVCENEPTGRGGLGAVFGFKNIKALSITGFSVSINQKGLASDVEKSFKAIDDALEESAFGNEMRRSGSSCLVSKAAKYGWAPIDNYRFRTDPRLFFLCGDELVRRYGREHRACMNCPVECRHVTKDFYPIPGYEAMLMLGSNLGCYEMEKIMERNALCLELGLDPVSTGNVLGWVKEAEQRRIASITGEGFSFKSNSCVLPLIELISRRTGAGEPLSYGTRVLAEAFEDESFAIHIRGLECGPFDYRGCYAQALSDACGNWFVNDFEVKGRLCTKSHANWSVLNESLVMGLESYGVSPCAVQTLVIDHMGRKKKLVSKLPKTARKVVKLDLITDALSAVLGYGVSKDDIFGLGDRTWRIIYEINCALGFDLLSEDAPLFPEFFTIDPSSNHQESSIVPIRELMSAYRYLRKYTIITQSSDSDD